MLKKNKKQFSLVLFIATALFAFVSFITIGLFLIASQNYDSLVLKGNQSRNDLLEYDKFFLNTEYQHNDPYTTKIPNLRDMLKGPIITSHDPSVGNLDSPVVLVLFSDFECSYCKKQEEILSDLVEEYNIRLIWKDYPSHYRESRSYQAAIASRCAQLENGFWNYHNLLYQRNSELSKSVFMDIANEMHFDMDNFESCIDNASTSYLIEDNMKEAEALDINGVPFLYVNDQELLGEVNKAELEKIIKLELEKTKK